MAKHFIHEFTEMLTFLPTNETIDLGGGVQRGIAATGNSFWAKVEELRSTQNQNESTTNDFKTYKAIVRDGIDYIWSTQFLILWNFRKYNITSISKGKIGKFEYLEIVFNEIYNG